MPTAIDPILRIAPEGAAPSSLSFDAFQEQQKVLLDAQERMLAIETAQVERLTNLTLTVGDKAQQLLQMHLQASADIAAQATAAAHAAQAAAAAANAAHAQARQAQADAAANPLFDAFIKFLKDQGVMQ